MIRSIIFFVSFLFLVTFSHAQKAVEGFQWYHPEADAKAEIAKAVKQAKKEHKHVILQVGGNWCIWCKRLHNLMDSNATVHNYLDSNFILVPVNYSKENKNLEVLKTLGYPQRFGYPVLVVLDEKGNRLHTQNSGYLEEGKRHSPAKVLEFLKHWSPAALDPKNYK